MIRLALHIVGLGAAFFALPKLLGGVKVKSFGAALIAAIVFSVLNAIFGVLLKFLLVLGTLGLAFIALNFIANTILLWATDKLIDEIEIADLGSLLFSSALLTLANGLLHAFIR